MIRTRTLYVMVSRTETGIARIIRAVSRYPYNHVSITLDDTLRSWYSFARYVQSAPLYSGFVRESAERLCAESGDVKVKVYRVSIPEINAARLEQLMPLAGDPESGLIYNHFDAVANAMGYHIPVPRCHTCLSFACEILDQQHTSIESLCEALNQNLIYEGDLSKLTAPDGNLEDAYFTPMSWAQGSVHSAVQLGILAMRTLSHGCQCYWKHISRRTVR